MRRIKIMPSAYIMLAAMMISDRLIIILLYFFAAALHELGHIAAARLLGLEVTELRFSYCGVRMRMDGGMMSYKKEILIAASGPLANIAVIMTAVSALTLMRISVESAQNSCIDLINNNLFTISGTLCFVSLSSLLQCMINLLPVRTLDGGRVIYCALAHIFGERVAERSLGVLSALSAFFLWTVALYLMLKISSGLGIYVFSACLFFGTVKKSSDHANLLQ